MASHPARLAAGAATLSLLALGAPAQAAPATPVAVSPGNLAAPLATCYGGAVRSYFLQGGWGGDAGPYTTTSRCGDINVRNASNFGTEACVIFIDKTDRCNYITYLKAGSGWTTVATDVRDGVRFKVRFSNLRFEYESLVAYHAF
ncbi:hypothetical protein ACFY3U_07930 [Micromonospora sp. NPDC000089]|uniref:hypothetical protein n=1 Tax=unclassified Micromonospora TaxID=2617518 RepID=UPI0036AA18F4